MRSRVRHAGVPGLPELDRCLVMGVINVTPDSFSDGGAFSDADSAIKHGRALLAAGADLLDIGGESTRPGAERVDAAEERRRVLPVVTALADAGAIVSIDTMRAETAEAAIAAGAQMVNDVSGGLADPDLPRVVARARLPYLVMHWRGHSADMQRLATYDDVVVDVCTELTARVDAVVAAGVDPDRVILDPGLGFAKTAQHNWTLLARFEELHALGRPLLVGASRKSFLGSLLDDGGRPVSDRDDATAAVTALVAAEGAWAVRVHDVRANADAVRVAAAVASARRAVR